MFRTAALILIIAGATSAHAAFEFSPIISKLAPSGPEASTTFNVSNSGDNKIPIQVTIVARDPDETGKEVYAENEDISDMFRIFPAQMVLNPKETRAIRVSYVGTPKLKSELAFRIIAEELPVDVTDPKKVYKKAVANVSIAIKYVGSLYVTPPGAKSEMLLEAQPVDQEVPVTGGKTAGKGKVTTVTEKVLVLTVTNKGSTHEIIRKPILKLQSLADKSEIVLQGAELPTLANLNILAGKTRKFILTWPKTLPVGPLKASFEVAKE